MAAEEAYSYSTWLRPWNPGLVIPASPACVRYRQCGEGQDQQRMNDDAQGGQLHLTPLDLFAEIFRRASDHQAADEHSQNGVQ